MATSVPPPPPPLAPPPISHKCLFGRSVSIKSSNWPLQFSTDFSQLTHTLPLNLLLLHLFLHPPANSSAGENGRATVPIQYSKYSNEWEGGGGREGRSREIWTPRHRPLITNQLILISKQFNWNWSGWRRNRWDPPRNPPSPHRPFKFEYHRYLIIIRAIHHISFFVAVVVVVVVAAVKEFNHPVILADGVGNGPGTSRAPHQRALPSPPLNLSGSKANEPVMNELNQAPAETHSYERNFQMNKKRPGGFHSIESIKPGGSGEGRWGWEGVLNGLVAICRQPTCQYNWLFSSNSTKQQ